MDILIVVIKIQDVKSLGILTYTSDVQDMNQSQAMTLLGHYCQLNNWKRCNWRRKVRKSYSFSRVIL